MIGTLERMVRDRADELHNHARHDARLIELSHPIRHGILTHPGLPGPEVSDHLTREESRKQYAPDTEFHIGRISLVGNTGTYVDAPSHRFLGAADLSGVGLASLVNLPGVVVRVPDGVTVIDRGLLARYRVDGMAVLVRTGWDRHWGTDLYGAGGHPFLTLDGAAHLAEAGAVLVGIDSVNIDDFADGTRPAHTTLLAQGVPIVEHLRGLDELPPDGFRFHAAPPLLEGLDSFPVRAYAVVAAA
jgi:kynurenine formamidase